MRRSVLWALGGALFLSLLAVVFDQRSPPLVSAIELGVRERAGAAEAALPSNTADAAVAVPLPQTLPATTIEAAERDIFASAARSTIPASAPTLAPLHATVLPATAVAPTPAQPPALSVRYMGSMVTPSGDRLVYLARGEASLSVVTGDRLEEGYVVEAIGEDSITLVHQAFGTKAVLAIPAGQSQ